MNKATSVLRIAVLIALGFTAMYLVFGMEDDAALGSFALHFLADKILGSAAAVLFACLYMRWSKTDPMLRAYDRLADKVADNDTEG